MRVPEDKIKQAICHEERAVRRHAIHYFSDAYSFDTEVMVKAIEAVELYGWEDAFGFLSVLFNLHHTEETFLWMIQAIEKIHSQNPDKMGECRIYQLGRIICKADISLLIKYDSTLMNLESLSPEYREVIAERIHLSGKSATECWAKLEQICEDESDEPYVNNFDFLKARLFGAVIARDQSQANRVLELLTSDIDAEYSGAMEWLELLVIYIAGEMRLVEAIPLLVEKLKIDSDGIDNECHFALVKIGGDEVLDQICDQYLDNDWNFRSYALGVLETLRCDRVVERSLELAKQEKDTDLKERLILVALNNFATEGIELALPGSIETREPLLAVSFLSEHDFPGRQKLLDEDREADKRIDGAFRKIVDTMKDYVQEKFVSSSFVDSDSAIEKLMPTPVVLPGHSGRKVGRNDSCPCGSGKKYKKCCLGKSQQV